VEALLAPANATPAPSSHRPATFATEPAIRIDYIALSTGQPWNRRRRHAGSLFAVAAWVGSTRLIDNTILG